jgi:hypothetical protein
MEFAFFVNCCNMKGYILWGGLKQLGDLSLRQPDGLAV